MNVDWSQTLIDRFITIALDYTLSYGDIAKILSREFHIRLTRNSCIGKARRLGMPARPNGPHRGGSRKGRAKPRHRKTPSPQPIVAAPPIVPKTKRKTGVTLLETGPRDCLWPINDGKPFLFCAQQKEHESPYCLHHTRMAYAGTGRVR